MSTGSYMVETEKNRMRRTIGKCKTNDMSLGHLIRVMFFSLD